MFSAEEASHVLNQLISNKIRFHELKHFSHIERTGTADKQSLKRILELKKSQKKINKVIISAINKNIKIQIDSGIELTLIKK